MAKYKRYELAIKCIARDYIDTLVVALVRQGFEAYLSDDEKVYIQIGSEDIRELKERI